MGCEFAEIMDLLDTFWAKLDLGCEEVDSLILVERAFHKGRLDDTLLTLRSLQQTLCKSGTSHCHGESCRTSTILGLDDLITTELDAVDKSIELLPCDVGMARLRDQWHNGDAGVATNDCDVLVGGVGSLDLRDESRGTDNIQGSDTEETLGVVDTLGLEDLANDRNGGVDLCSCQWSQEIGEGVGGLTGLEMTKTLALGAASATAFARSRTMLALVLKRSENCQNSVRFTSRDHSVYHLESCQAFGGLRRG